MPFSFAWVPLWAAGAQSHGDLLHDMPQRCLSKDTRLRHYPSAAMAPWLEVLSGVSTPP